MSEWSGAYTQHTNSDGTLLHMWDYKLAEHPTVVRHWAEYDEEAERCDVPGMFDQPMPYVALGLLADEARGLAAALRMADKVAALLDVPDESPLNCPLVDVARLLEYAADEALNGRR
jgi:hypothetical protein